MLLCLLLRGETGRHVERSEAVLLNIGFIRLAGDGLHDQA
jgi:hypothetical protein